MNIGIFETQHFEGAYPMIRILDIPGNNLTIYVNEETYRRFVDLFGKDMANYKWIIQPAYMSNRRFIFEIYKTVKKNKIKLFFLNTVSANFILYAWAAAMLPSTKVILTLHDANNFLQSGFSFNFRKSVRHVGKKMLARFCYAYSTVSETVLEHLKESKGIRKKIFCIPGAVFESKKNILNNFDTSTPLRIVVPGSIDKRRRDYDKVFDLLEQVNKYSLNVIIVLAGGPYESYGEMMINKFKDYSHSHQNLIFYSSPVLDQHIFDKELDATHFVWIPSAINSIIADDIEETYGLTKSSGNIFDAIKHATPLLIPQRLAIQPQLLTSVYKYETIASLTEFLIKILGSPETYRQFKNEAYSNSMNYTAEKMRERIRELLTY